MFFADAKADKTIQRLKVLKTAKNGFELAELDLIFTWLWRTWRHKTMGHFRPRNGSHKNIKMVEAARAEAIRLISEDPELSKYPLLKKKVHEKAGEFHLSNNLSLLHTCRI